VVEEDGDCMPTREQVDLIGRAIDSRRDDAISMLQQLVAAPSITGAEQPAQDVVERLMRQRGLSIDRWEATPEEIEPYYWHVGEETIFSGRPNLAGTRPGSVAGGGRSILLNAHMDTVDYGDERLWTYPPLSGTVVGDRLYGRGSCDMKGGLVTYLLAMDVLDELGIHLSGDVTVATTVGEENGGVGALATILRGYRADGVLITEPTRLALVPAQGGSLVMRLTIQGKSAHGAVRDEGVSALEKFIPIFNDLMAFERERNTTLRHPLYQHLSNKVPISFGVVKAGTWASTVPEQLVAEGRIGLVPGEDVDEFRTAVSERIMSAAGSDAWLREHPPVIEWFGGQFAPAETALHHPLCQTVLAAHQAVTGNQPVVEGVPYGADMRLFTLIGNMPCVMYGAGDVRVAHQNDEHISISDLLTAATTISTFLIDWCGVAATN
jgi:acetylornithine deacetylase